ncbi:ShlB/FhaC/HecB family hemolysin secretion/activation protein [Roseibium litorale]|uniref:ShlB/FhaC/HecB family hemolysin secretion/activation protein n=1 Tax=Roseibium litorale TaxID=2803841 RepID=A0ABR9CQR9_9HYPH|nr:ShlB/FhaC/HecB family hemolysin secretion/activation protein [Roseibium litorale]MBD8892632.1 ShlB/FhaC/HecB family hemolysin secretion/activation protein [Roseibium litorale]
MKMDLSVTKHVIAPVLVSHRLSAKDAFGAAAQRRAIAAMLTAGLVCAIASPAAAQSVENAVAGQTTIIDRFTPPSRPGTVDITVEDQRKRVPDNKAEAMRFRLRSISVEGAQAVPNGTLEAVWQDRIGEQISLAELYRIAEAVDAAYLRAGYLSMTVVPVQNFKSGEVTLRVYEGYLETVEITSSIPNIRERLAPYIRRLTSMRPIRIKEAERILLLMSDLGGLQIEGTLVRPQTPSGGGTLKLAVDFNRYSAGIGLDNLGTDEVGPVELSGNISVNDIFGLFETTSLVGVTIPDSPEEMILLQASQSVPIGFNGLSAGYDLTYVTQKPGGDLKNDDIDIETVIGTANLQYPFLRTIDQSLYGKVEINLRNDRIDVMGMRAARERTRWATMGLRYDLSFGETSFSAGTELGQSLSHDVEDASVPDDYRFGRADFDISHSLGSIAQLHLRTTGQYSPTPLPGSVRFSLGGDPYGWAFDGGSLSGDSGVASAFEVSHDFETGWSTLPGVTLTAFADYGIVWRADAAAEYSRDSLGSAGIGVSGMVAERVNFQLLTATPWHKPENADDPGTRVFFRLGLAL